jgi:hypothetical protein
MAEEAERHEVNALHRSRYGGSGDMLISEFIGKVYLPWARTNKRHPRMKQSQESGHNPVTTKKRHPLWMPLNH